MFSTSLEPLCVRLAFHDCIPYDDGNGGTFGGCDGCMNFDENRGGNNALQHSVAILVIVFLQCSLDLCVISSSEVMKDGVVKVDVSSTGSRNEFLMQADCRDQGSLP